MTDRPLFILEIAMELAFPKFLLDQIAKSTIPEKAREAAMSTSVGGIGPLLKDRIFGQAALGLDVVGVSLLYERVWVQSWQEWGQLNLQKKSVGPDLKKVLKPTPHGFELVGFAGEKISVDVWECAYGSASVYFLSSPSITDVVYPGPKDAPHGTLNPHQWSHDFRLKQSWLLGRGALALCKKLGRKPDVINLSETPTLFGHSRLVKDDFQTDPFFSDTKYVFNDHTPLEYAHPIWDQHTIDMVKLDSALTSVSPGWNAQKKTLDLTSLLVGTCDGVFGVAKKHADVMRAMPSLKAFSNKIQYITNGVRKEDWQAPELKDPGSLSDEALLEAKLKFKRKLLDWAWRRCRLWSKWADDSLKRKIVILTRRITPYKRLDVLLEAVENKELRERFLKLNMIVFVGGRIHQQDNHAQDIVYDLLDLVDKDSQLRERIIFIDNFNIWDAPIIFQGADAAIMMADDTREASATGFMKAQMNGGVVIATSDGAVPEFVHFESSPEHPQNGFLIPYVNGGPTPPGLIGAFENYDRASQSVSQTASLMRAALTVTSQVDIERTANQMKSFYENLFSVQPASVSS